MRRRAKGTDAEIMVKEEEASDNNSNSNSNIDVMMTTTAADPHHDATCDSSSRQARFHILLLLLLPGGGMRLWLLRVTPFLILIFWILQVLPLQHMMMTSPSSSSSQTITSISTSALWESLQENFQSSQIHPNKKNETFLEDKIAGNESFAACLIIMDDNHWLIEWLAYHYHALPLRHLLFVRDPKSVTSPNAVLDRWRDKMTIEEWTDNDFLPEWVPKKAVKQQLTGKWLHLNRQMHFYGHCLRHMHQQQQQYHNRTRWVMLTDTDEFLRVNPYAYTLSNAVRQRPGHVLQFLQQRNVSNPCLMAPRIQLPSIESNQSVMPAVTVPPPFDAKQFLTLRWLDHNGREMGAGKNIVNLQHFALEDLPQRVASVHYVVEASCPRNTGDHLHSASSYLQLQHYLGTWEQFTYRDDPRDALDDRLQEWSTRGRRPPPVVHDTGMTAWLAGFVRAHGIVEAQRLLHNVGVLEPRAENDTRVLVPPLMSGNGTISATSLGQHMGNFSACLITKDDNHWLIEWLAYHYHTLPLRRLIVVSDPTSRTSPDEIFERWQGRMTIDRWEQSSFVPNHIEKKYDNGDITNALMHRYRQKFFYAKCLRELKHSNASWVLLSDTDEFVRPNPSTSHRVPPLHKSGAVMNFLRSQIKRRRTVDGSFQPPHCLFVPRIQMTAKESNATIVQAEVPEGFSGMDMMTTRWMYHNGQEIVFGHNLDGKNIINLRYIAEADIPQKVENVHHIIETCPVSDGNRLAHKDSWLMINHYPGTFEQYSFREDPRNDIPGRPKRDQSLWAKLGQNPPAEMLDTSTRQWISGFVRLVGPLAAAELLKDVGRTNPVPEKVDVA